MSRTNLFWSIDSSRYPELTVCLKVNMFMILCSLTFHCAWNFFMVLTIYYEVKLEGVLLNYFQSVSSETKNLLKDWDLY